MPTITVTATNLMLMQSTDVVATHLLIVAQGLPTGRNFLVPAGRTLRQYGDDHVLLADTLGLVGLIMRGTLSPAKTSSAGQSLPDYSLAPVRGFLHDPDAARLTLTALLQYIEQSGQRPGASTPGEVGRLGQGVSCDLLCLRPLPVSHWLSSSRPRLSKLLTERLLTQYRHIHCLVRRVPRSSAPPRATHLSGP
jgi:hypothetical protein